MSVWLSIQLHELTDIQAHLDSDVPCAPKSFCLCHACFVPQNHWNGDSRSRPIEQDTQLAFYWRVESPFYATEIQGLPD